jgi:hypothetical protein
MFPLLIGLTLAVNFGPMAPDAPARATNGGRRINGWAYVRRRKGPVLGLLGGAPGDLISTPMAPALF